MNIDEAIANAERLAEWCDRPSNQTDVAAATAMCSQAFSLLALAKIARGDAVSDDIAEMTGVSGLHGFHRRAITCPRCGLTLRRNDGQMLTDEKVDAFLSADCDDMHGFATSEVTA